MIMLFMTFLVRTYLPLYVVMTSEMNLNELGLKEVYNWVNWETDKVYWEQPRFRIQVVSSCFVFKFIDTLNVHHNSEC